VCGGAGKRARLGKTVNLKKVLSANVSFSFPLFCRVNSFVAKVLGTATSGAITMVVCSQCFSYLARMWCIAGVLESSHAVLPVVGKE